MPNKNTIVATIVLIDPPVEKSGSEAFKLNPAGFSITFDGDLTAHLTPSDQAAGILEILEELRQMGIPAYVDVNPDTQEISHLLIPLVSKVANVSENKKEEIEVELEISHARHVLTRENPDFSEYLETLHTAREKNAWLIITETDRHEIIDVRLSPYKPEPPKVEMPLVRSKCWLCRWFKWLCCLCKCLRCVPESKARQMFSLVSSKTCAPLTVPSPCIPFLYPDDGCWARAHEMCRLIIAAGLTPKKVWIDGNLHTNTKNNPNCYVNWGWHVAPTICVRRGFCQVEDMVIDPSLFSEPVSKAAWKAVQGDPNAILTDTDASLYWRNYMPTDPNYVDTNIRLQFYRLQLKNRSLNYGPPPYAHCP